MPILSTSKLVKFLALFCGSGILLLLIFPLTTTAAFTKQINYQGKLTNSSGAAVTDGSYDMVLKLYDAPTGGTALWTETRTGTNQVAVASGLFSIMLGSVASLDAVNFNQPLYLGLTVGTDSEMTPRKALGAVASSFTAEKFDGLATTSFLRSDITNATGTITNLNSQYLSVSGNLGIGTTSPTEKLVIDGGSLSSYNSLTNDIGSIFNSFSQTTGFANSSLVLGAPIYSGVYGYSTQSVDAYEYTPVGLFGRADGAASLGVLGEVVGNDSRGGVFYANGFGSWGLSISAVGEDSFGANINASGLNSTGLSINLSGANTDTGLDVSVADGFYGLKVLNSSTTQYSIYSSGGKNYFGGATSIDNDLTVTSGHGITLGGEYRTVWPTVGVGGSGSFWATSSDSLIGYPDLSGNFAIVIGAAATTSGDTDTSMRLKVAGNTKLAGNLLVTGASTLTGDTTLSGDLNLSAGKYLKYNGANLAYGSTTKSNYFFGEAGNMTMTGADNLAFGIYALSANTTGRYNIALGNFSLTQNTSGHDNIAIGSASLPANLTGYANIALGTNALNRNTTGLYNTAIGYQTLANNTTGSSNIAIGLISLINNTTGSDNIALGDNALASNATGSDNVVLGSWALSNLVSGSGNTAIGSESLLSATSSVVGLTALGYKSGVGLSAVLSDYASRLDANSTFLGYGASRNNNVASTTALTNATAIGYNAKVGGSNMLALGGLGADAVNVGIATSTPYYSLVVGSGAVGSSPSIQVPRGGLCVDDDGWCDPATAGTIYALVYASQGHSDLAEYYPSFEINLSPGYIVSGSDANESGTSSDLSFGVKKAHVGQNFLGIISSNPGFVLGLGDDGENKNQVPVALSGRVPTKVNLEGGPIMVGDYITLSSVPGVGTKATTSGQTVGVALESYNGSSPEDTSGLGTINVFVNLGYAQISPQVFEGKLNSDNFWQVDDITGQIKALGSFDLNNFNLTNIRAITSASGNWSIDEGGNLVTKSVATDKLCLGATCVTEGELKTLLDKAGLLPVSIPTPTTPPTIDPGPVATPTPAVIEDPVTPAGETPVAEPLAPSPASGVDEGGGV